MTDIVERLRTGRWPMMAEAADEIERLTEERVRWRSDNERLTVDNDRLRAALHAIEIQALATHPPHEYARRALEQKP